MEVYTATSGLEGVERIKTLQKGGVFMDLIIVDWMMPVMDGLEVISLIKEIYDKEAHMVKILLATGYGKEEVIHQSGFTESDGLLLKPVTQSLLFNQIVDVLCKEVSIYDLNGYNKPEEDTPMLPDIKAILVEDNDINAQIAMEVMQQEGMHITWFKDGEEVVEYLLKKSDVSDVDLIFMDLQMPVMDGYEATKALRKRFSLEELPIIAMTADAVKGVEDKAMAAGMNAFITKPINMRELFDVIGRFANKSMQNSPAQVTMAVLPFEKLHGIDVEDGMFHTGNNTKLYRSLLQKFYMNYCSCVDQLRMYLGEGDMDEAKRLVHTIKGVASNLGMTVLHGYAEELEKHMSDKMALDNLALKRFENEVIAICNSLQEMLDRNTNEQGHVALKMGDLKILKEYLQILSDYLRKGDIKGAKNAYEMIEQYDWPSSYYSDLKLIRNNINKYQLDRAGDIVNRLNEGINN